jgi:hypothetical protein
MRRRTILLTITATILVLLQCSVLRAQVTASFLETWVSGVGDNRNPCSRTSPCRTFTRALEVTSPGGHIGVLDAGDFGQLGITKAVSVINHGAGEARVTINRADSAVGVFAGAGDRVYLRGLTIDGGNVGVYGILFQTGAALHVQDCVIKNFRGAASLPAHGISFEPSGASELYVSDTLIAGSGSSALPGSGIHILPGGNSNIKAVFNRVRLENNRAGIEVDGRLSTAGRIEAITGPPGLIPPPGLHVSIRDSVVAGSDGPGIKAISTALTASEGTRTTVMIDRSSSIHNSLGMVVDGGKATVRVANSTVTNNGTGLSAINNGRLDYANNNNIADNRVSIEEPPSGL